MTFVLANWQEFLEILPENISEFYAVKIEIVYGDAAGPTAVCQCWGCVLITSTAGECVCPLGGVQCSRQPGCTKALQQSMCLHFWKQWLIIMVKAGKKVPILIYSSLFTAWRLRWVQRYSVFRSREVGGKKKIKAPKIGCTCFRLCSCCTQNVFLNEVNLFAWFYIYGSLLSTCKISLWQLPHTQGGWTKAVQSGGEKILTHWQ